MNKKLTTPHDFGRHGEVILLKVERIPSEAKIKEENNSVIVGHSESGHHHTLTAEQGVTIKIYETADGRMYLDLPSKGTLVHQKTSEQHETQVFSPNFYERIVRQSYSYSDKIMRRVQD